MMPYFSEQFGNPHSADHILGWESSKAVEGATLKIAQMIDADADEIIFTSGATEANNLALLGMARGNSEGPRRRILVSSIEHKSIFAISRILTDSLRFEVITIPVDDRGVIVLSALEEALDERVLLVSIGLVNSEIGSIQPLEKIYDLCRSCGALLHCDGAQAPSSIDLSNASQSLDFLSLSAHKMYGPKGLGALFIRRSLQEMIQPIIEGGGQQRHLRSGTVPTPLCVGMGIAAEIMSNGQMPMERETLRSLRDRFVSRLQELSFPIHLNGPPLKERHPGNANLRFEGFSAPDILNALQPRLAASTGSACTTGIPEPSHVLTAIRLTDTEADASIRFSLGRHTTGQDIDDALSLIQGTLEKLA